MKKIYLSIIASLLMFSTSAKSSSSHPPAPTFNPDYRVNVLFVSDKSMLHKAPFIIKNHADELTRARFLDTHISDFNSVLKNSQANVKAYKAGYVNMSNRQFKSFVEAARSSDIEKYKKHFNADVVVLFAYLDFGHDRCGRATLGQDFVGISLFVRLCSSTQTFNHEMGHIFGLVHSKHDNPRPVYATGYGTAAWVDIMAYPFKHGGLIRKRVYSNPNIKCDAIHLCGQKDYADGVRAINESLSKRFSRNK